eukprot:RCo008199
MAALSGPSFPHGKPKVPHVLAALRLDLALDMLDHQQNSRGAGSRSVRFLVDPSRGQSRDRSARLRSSDERFSRPAALPKVPSLCAGFSAPSKDESPEAEALYLVLSHRGPTRS